MANVLVVRKKDRTIHVVPMANRANLMAYNNRQPVADRYKLEVMDEEEAKKLPFIDRDYVSASDAQVLLKDAKSELSEKDAQIAELEARLAALQTSASEDTKTAKKKAPETTDQK